MPENTLLVRKMAGFTMLPNKPRNGPSTLIFLACTIITSSIIMITRNSLFHLNICYSTATFLSSSKSSSTLPEPKATALSGSSDTIIGKPVS